MSGVGSTVWERRASFLAWSRTPAGSWTHGRNRPVLCNTGEARPHPRRPISNMGPAPLGGCEWVGSTVWERRAAFLTWVQDPPCQKWVCPLLQRRGPSLIWVQDRWRVLDPCWKRASLGNLGFLGMSGVGWIYCLGEKGLFSNMGPGRSRGAGPMLEMGRRGWVRMGGIDCLGEKGRFSNMDPGLSRGPDVRNISVLSSATEERPSQI